MYKNFTIDINAKIIHEVTVYEKTNVSVNKNTYKIICIFVTDIVSDTVEHKAYISKNNKNTIKKPFGNIIDTPLICFMILEDIINNEGYWIDNEFIKPVTIKNK